MKQWKPSANWFIGLILLLAFIVYLPGLQYEFVFDDHAIIENDETVHSLAAALDKVFHPATGYRPVRNLSLAVDYTLGGLNAGIFHLSNIFYHLLVLLALWLVLKETLGPGRVALMALAIFAVHPVHIDAVAYISGRRDLLSTLFSLLSFWCYLRFRKTRRLWLWVPVLLLFALAYFSKEMGLVVPVMIVLYDWVAETSALAGPSSWARPLQGIWAAIKKGAWYYGLLSIGVGYGLYRIFLGNVTGKVNWWGGNIFTNFLTTAKILVYDILLMVFPFHLQADYSYDSFPIAFSIGDPAGWAAVVFLVLLWIYLVWSAVRRRSTIAFWGLFFFALLLPVSHIIPHHELLAEHYLYLPSAGFCVLAALGLDRLFEWRKSAAAIAAAAMATVCLAAHLLHMGAYRDDLTLFRDVLSKSPKCVRANYSLAEYYFGLSDFQQAAHYYENIIAVPPLFQREGVRLEDYPQLNALRKSSEGEWVNREVGYYTKAYGNLGKIYETLGDPTRAKEMFRRGAQFGIYLDLMYNSLGKICAAEGHFEEAVDWFEKALRSAPDDALSLSNLGAAYGQMGQWEKSCQYLQRAVDRDPADPSVHYNMALALTQMRRNTEAVQHLNAALEKGLVGENADNARRLLAQLQGK